jgi:general secretion pathway protein K
MMALRAKNNRGIVLVFALWVLGILTILAVSVAAGVRQKIFLVARLDERSRMTYLLESAVKKTAGYIHQEMEEASFVFTSTVKMNLFNNAAELAAIGLGRDQAGVGYIAPDGDSTALRWGVVDEESKINLNKTDLITLTNLLMGVLSMKQEDAQKLAQSLLDWRQYGEGQVTGFYSQDYYTNLQYPYPKKSAAYETLDELLLVQGMNKKIYDKLIDYVTIYGDGTVNINTASKAVLEALGLPDELADKIITVRRGKDLIDGTPDDNVFLRTFELSADINAIVPLTLDEGRRIDALNARGILTASSFFYTINATARLSGRGAPKSVRAVYSSRDDKIIYWKER